jgi:Flp pilus assembly protein TadD
MKTIHALTTLAASLILAACVSAAGAAAGTAATQSAMNKSATATSAADANQVSTSDLLGRGYAAIRANRIDEAEALLQQARAQSPNDPYVLLNLGVVYQMKRQNMLAEQYYNDTIRVSGNTIVEARDTSVLATAEVGVNSSPAIIARRNLTLIK